VITVYTQVLATIPVSHRNVFKYICAFLRKLLQHSTSNKLDVKSLGQLLTCTCSCCCVVVVVVVVVHWGVVRSVTIARGLKPFDTCLRRGDYLKGLFS